MTGDVPIIHVVDDNSKFRGAVARLLRASGYDVKFYESAGRQSGGHPPRRALARITRGGVFAAAILISTIVRVASRACATAGAVLSRLRAPKCCGQDSRFSWRWSRLACLIVVGLASFGANAAEPKRILLLDSFGRNFAPWNEYGRNFVAELNRQREGPVDIYEASLATAQFADESAEGPFVDYLRSLFPDRKLDLVVTLGAPATRFFQKHRQQLFPATPMLVTAVEQRLVPATLTPNDIAVALNIDLAAVIQNILQVLPETTSIAVVIGNSPLERYWTEQIRVAAQPYVGRVSFTWFNELPFEEMIKRAAALPPRSAIYFILLSVDAAGVQQAVERMHAVANAPMFSYIDAYFGQGVVGGPMISVLEAGRRAASVAVRLLRGEEPSSIRPEPVGFAVPMFDWRELKRWNISEEGLPPGSEIRFRPPGIWEQYRTEVTIASAVVLLQSVTIAVLLFERNRRRRAELRARRHLLEAIHLNRTATAGAMSASIAHELNQPLGAILSYAEAAELYLKADPPNIARVEEILANIRRDDERAADIINHLRGLLKKKDAIEWQEFDLKEAVDDALHILQPEALKRGVVLGADHVEGPATVRADQIHLQQVILNLAMNGMDAMQGCAPGTGRISIQTALVEDSLIEVSVTDNGTGIPADKLNDVFATFYTTKRQGTGLGLSIARTIIETYSGKIWAENRASGGAVFRFVLPLSKEPAA